VQEQLAPRRTYGRETVEFARTLTFTDGLFAIAMTLLVVAIAVPNIADEDSISDLADALNDLTPNFISFFISFAVIGRYWLAHHQSVALLEAMDQGYIRLNLVPVAFLSTVLAACMWFLGIPLAAIAERWKPEGADEVLLG
jgi:uncharacterized membrane protein